MKTQVWRRNRNGNSNYFWTEIVEITWKDFPVRLKSLPTWSSQYLDHYLSLLLFDISDFRSSKSTLSGSVR